MTTAGIIDWCAGPAITTGSPGPGRRRRKRRTGTWTGEEWIHAYCCLFLLLQTVGPVGAAAASNAAQGTVTPVDGINCLYTVCVCVGVIYLILRVLHSLVNLPGNEVRGERRLFYKRVK